MIKETTFTLTGHGRISWQQLADFMAQVQHEVPYSDLAQATIRGRTVPPFSLAGGVPSVTQISVTVRVPATGAEPADRSTV